MRRTNRSGLLIIGDSLMFNQAIRMGIDDAIPTSLIQSTTYSAISATLTSAMVTETKLFVLELWRTYPSGIRAEGVALAECLLRLGGTPLIVAPLTIGRGVATCYWDYASVDRLDEKCKSLLSQRVRSAAVRSDLNQLSTLFKPFLGVPKEHDQIGEARKSE